MCQQHAQLGLSPKPDIRRAELLDFERIMDIENSCFPGELAYSRRQMRYLLFKARGRTYVETLNGTVRGYITVLYQKNSDKASVETLGVDPECRGKGVARRLMEKAERDMARFGIKRSVLEVSEGNTPAINMYTSSGYTILKRLDNYYQYPHHGTKKAFRMQKKLKSEDVLNRP